MDSSVGRAVEAASHVHTCAAGAEGELGVKSEGRGSA